MSLIYAYNFKEFIGKPVDNLLTEVRKHYPFADLDFSGSGQIYFLTGLWLGSRPIKIKTRLYEDDRSGISILSDKPV